MKEIKLTQGMVALVDDEDYEFLNQWKWHARKDGYSGYYAVRMDYGFKPKKMIKMHRVIMNVDDPKTMVDHKDHQTLDNRKINLRPCTIGQNAMNKTSKRNSSSKYLGVSINTRARKWVAQIQQKRKNVYLGSYNDELSAAIAYNKKAAELFGEYANLNKI